MLEKKKILAIIPARAKSIRLKNKNFLKLVGKPLIQHTIDKLLSIKMIDKIIISTDKKNIHKIIKKRKKIFFHFRSKNLSNAKTPVFKTILEIAKKNPEFDIISYFLPTNPLLPKTDIKLGYLNLKKFRSYISVTQFEDPIEISLRLDSKNNQIKPVFSNLKNNNTNSRFLRKSYRPTGSFYMIYRKDLLKNKTFFIKRSVGIIYSSLDYVDINNQKDFDYAKYLLKKNVKKKD